RWWRESKAGKLRGVLLFGGQFRGRIGVMLRRGSSNDDQFQHLPALCFHLRNWGPRLVDERKGIEWIISGDIDLKADFLFSLRRGVSACWKAKANEQDA